MEFDTVVRKRHSVRSFKRKKADWRDIIEAIDSALQGPFAGNHNNLKFLVVEDKEKINQIAKACEQLWMSQAGILVVVCSDDKHLENLYGNRGRVYSRQQAGAAIQTFLLKCVDLGLSACWVGSYADADIRKIVQAPKEIQIEAIIPIGYSTQTAKEKRKHSLERTLYWENWGNAKRPSWFEESRTE